MLLALLSNYILPATSGGQKCQHFAVTLPARLGTKMSIKCCEEGRRGRSEVRPADATENKYSNVFECVGCQYAKTS